MYRFFQPIITIIFIGLLASCAGIPLTKPEAPQVSVAGFRLVKANLLEQNYQLKLRLKNPNSFPMPISALNFQLFLNDKEFTKGTNKQPVTIPALGETVLELEFVSNLMDIVDGWRDWKNALTNRKFDYLLSGGVSLANWAPQIPFKDEGEISLENLQKKLELQDIQDIL